MAGGAEFSSGSEVEPPHVFMSYRRADYVHFSGRFYDKLVGVFGYPNVFRDLELIPPGSEFLAVILDKLRNIDVVVALIGPQWAGKVASPDDYVRIEIVEALKAGRPVFPVLIEDTALPAPTDLPEDLRPLLGLNATRVRSDPDFHADADRVIGGIQRAVAEARSSAEDEKRSAADQAARDAEAKAEAQRRADEATALQDSIATQEAKVAQLEDEANQLTLKRARAGLAELQAQQRLDNVIEPARHVSKPAPREPVQPAASLPIRPPPPGRSVRPPPPGGSVLPPPPGGSVLPPPPGGSVLPPPPGGSVLPPPAGGSVLPPPAGSSIARPGRPAPVQEARAVPAAAQSARAGSAPLYARVAGGAGAVVSVTSLFLPWYGFDFDSSFSFNASGVESGSLAVTGSLLAFVGGLLSVGWAKVDRQSARQRRSGLQAFGLATVGFVLIAVRLETGPDFVQYGIYVALAAAATSALAGLAVARAARKAARPGDPTGAR